MDQLRWMQLMPSLIMMDTIKAITNRNGHDWCYHREAPKRLWSEPLERNEEGRGDQPRSHKAASPTNATRASWVTQRNSSRDVDNRRRCVNRHDASTTNATMKLGGKPRADQANSRLRSLATRASRSTTKRAKKWAASSKKHAAAVTCMPRVTCSTLWAA